jgi:two-component system CitB family sensor kinase
MAIRRLSTQIVTSQLVILATAALIGFGLFTNAERRHLDGQYQDRALAIAATTASIPLIREALEYGDPGNAIQSTAERIRVASNAAYVVVIDLHGIRHSHPNPKLIGRPVEEPLIVLDGHGHTGVDHGSLGLSANGKAPVYGPSGNLVGEVSAGILETAVSATLGREVPVLALYLMIALATGAAASYVLARRLKRITFGLELHEFASLLREREAMLHGVREGVIAFDTAGRVTVVNDEARRLLDIDTCALGRPLDDLLPTGRLRDLLSSAQVRPDETVLTDERCLTVNRMPVTLRGQQLGAIVTLRDRTELVGVLRELDNVRGLSDALRAQQHEFANQMHTIAGLIELGDPAQALAYITETRAASAERAEAIRERVGNPLVAALVLAKQTMAAERGVDLRLADESWLGEARSHTKALLTLIGNLLDNAIDAAGTGGTVSLLVAQDETGTTVQVNDTGPGIDPAAVHEIFQDGYSTKSARGPVRRGLGLALVHRVVARLGGTIEVRPGPGATFTAWLPASADLLVGTA